MADRIEGKKSKEKTTRIQIDIPLDFFKKGDPLDKKTKAIEREEVGTTKFRSIVEGVEDGKSLVIAKRIRQGVRLSIISGKTEFSVVDPLAKDVVTATRRTLLIGEEEVRLNRWALEAGYGINCSINSIGMR